MNSVILLHLRTLFSETVAIFVVGVVSEFIVVEVVAPVFVVVSLGNVQLVLVGEAGADDETADSSMSKRSSDMLESSSIFLTFFRAETKRFPSIVSPNILNGSVYYALFCGNFYRNEILETQICCFLFNFCYVRTQLKLRACFWRARARSVLFESAVIFVVLV